MQKELKSLNEIQKKPNITKNKVTDKSKPSLESEEKAYDNFIDHNTSAFISTLNIGPNYSHNDPPAILSKHKIVLTSQIPIQTPELILHEEQNLNKDKNQQLNQNANKKSNENEVQINLENKNHIINGNENQQPNYDNNQTLENSNKQKKIRYSKSRSINGSRRAPRPSQIREDKNLNLPIDIPKFCPVAISSLNSSPPSPSSNLSLADCQNSNPDVSLSSTPASSSTSSQSSPSPSTNALSDLDKQTIEIQENNQSIKNSSLNQNKEQLITNKASTNDENHQSQKESIPSDNDDIDQDTNNDSPKSSESLDQNHDQSNAGVVEFSNNTTPNTVRSHMIFGSTQQRTMPRYHQNTMYSQFQHQQMQMMQNQYMNQNLSNLMMQYNQLQIEELNTKQTIQNLILQLSHPSMQNKSLKDRNILKMTKVQYQQKLILIQQKIKYIRQQIEMLQNQQIMVRLTMFGGNGIQQFQMYQQLLKTKNSLIDYLSKIEYQMQEIMTNRYTPQQLQQLQLEQQQYFQIFQMNLSGNPSYENSHFYYNSNGFINNTNNSYNNNYNNVNSSNYNNNNCDDDDNNNNNNDNDNNNDNNNNNNNDNDNNNDNNSDISNSNHNSIEKKKYSQSALHVEINRNTNKVEIKK